MTATGLDTSVAPTRIGRLLRGQTAIDFYGHRRIGWIGAVVVVVVTVVSLLTQGLNLGLDFEGGNAWEIPTSDTFGVDEAEQVLEDNDISAASARIQVRSSETASVVTVQLEVLPAEEAAALTRDFADAAGVTVQDITFSFTSSNWGAEITEKAIRALIVFLAIVSVFITIRFEWRMAVAGIAAMIHDVVFAIGVYSVFQFDVTPETVIAFLTILGYSLYDTIVVFDRVKENEAHYAGVRMPYPDTVNISMNQVLIRSLNTSVAAVLPVISLLVIGAGLLGAVTLREFALALLVGMIAGVYSSILIATPLLAALKGSSGRATHRQRLTGEALRAAVIGSGVSGRIATVTAETTPDEPAAPATRSRTPVAAAPSADRLLTHAPRPRKKKRH